MREVPRDPSTGAFLDGQLPCDLPLAAYWTCSAILIAARLALGCINLYVLLALRESGNKGRRRLRGLAPMFDIANTVFVILFLALAPVTSSRNGTSWVLFGLAFAPYFVSGILFLMKMIRNRRRIGTTAVGSNSSGGHQVTARLGNPNFKLRQDKWVVFLLTLCWIGTAGSTFVWILGAAAFGGSVICHRVAIVLFCLMTSTAQLVGFSESVSTARALSRHIKQTGQVAQSNASALRNVRHRLLRSAIVFIPLWAASTLILLLLAAGVLPFHWYITFILLSMPVINAASATAMFFRRRRAPPKALVMSPKVLESNNPKLDTSSMNATSFRANPGLTMMKSVADATIFVHSEGRPADDDED